MDRNGCDTRNDILARDLEGETFKPGTRDCVVLTGTLDDPYTATTIAFERGNATSSAVQIDHVVALSDAWQKGAPQLGRVTGEAGGAGRRRAPPPSPCARARPRRGTSARSSAHWCPPRS